MRPLFALWTALLVVLATAPATAANDTEEELPDETYNHALQFGLRSTLLGGYRMVFRYDDSPLCNEPEPGGIDEQQTICGHLGPAMVDVAASFALLGSVEPFAMIRLGLVGEHATNTRPLRLVAVGTRLYTRHNHKLKIFIEPSLGVEFESGADDPAWTLGGTFEPQYKTDLVFRAAVGPQLDLARNVGIYAQVFGMSVGILRYIHATMEFGAGVQARFP